MDGVKRTVPDSFLDPIGTETTALASVWVEIQTTVAFLLRLDTQEARHHDAWEDRHQDAPEVGHVDAQDDGERGEIREAERGGGREAGYERGGGRDQHEEGDRQVRRQGARLRDGGEEQGGRGCWEQRQEAERGGGGYQGCEPLRHEGSEASPPVAQCGGMCAALTHHQNTTRQLVLCWLLLQSVSSPPASSRPVQEPRRSP